MNLQNGFYEFANKLFDEGKNIQDLCVNDMGEIALRGIADPVPTTEQRQKIIEVFVKAIDEIEAPDLSLIKNNSSNFKVIDEYLLSAGSRILFLKKIRLIEPDLPINTKVTMVSKIIQFNLFVDKSLQNIYRYRSSENLKNVNFKNLEMDFIKLILPYVLTPNSRSYVVLQGEEDKIERLLIDFIKNLNVINNADENLKNFNISLFQSKLNNVNKDDVDDLMVLIKKDQSINNDESLTQPNKERKLSKNSDEIISFYEKLNRISDPELKWKLKSYMLENKYDFKKFEHLFEFALADENSAKEFLITFTTSVKAINLSLEILDILTNHPSDSRIKILQDLTRFVTVLNLERFLEITITTDMTLSFMLTFSSKFKSTHLMNDLLNYYSRFPANKTPISSFSDYFFNIIVNLPDEKHDKIDSIESGVYWSNKFTGVEINGNAYYLFVLLLIEDPELALKFIETIPQNEKEVFDFFRQHHRIDLLSSLYYPMMRFQNNSIKYTPFESNDNSRLTSREQWKIFHQISKKHPEEMKILHKWIEKLVESFTEDKPWTELSNDLSSRKAVSILNLLMIEKIDPEMFKEMIYTINSLRSFSEIEKLENYYFKDPINFKYVAHALKMNPKLIEHLSPNRSSNKSLSYLKNFTPELAKYYITNKLPINQNFWGEFESMMKLSKYPLLYGIQPDEILVINQNNPTWEFSINKLNVKTQIKKPIDFYQFEKLSKLITLLSDEIAFSETEKVIEFIQIVNKYKVDDRLFYFGALYDDFMKDPLHSFISQIIELDKNERFISEASIKGLFKIAVFSGIEAGKEMAAYMVKPVENQKFLLPVYWNKPPFTDLSFLGFIERIHNWNNNSNPSLEQKFISVTTLDWKTVLLEFLGEIAEKPQEMKIILGFMNRHFSSNLLMDAFEKKPEGVEVKEWFDFLELTDKNLLAFLSLKKELIKNIYGFYKKQTLINSDFALTFISEMSRLNAPTASALIKILDGNQVEEVKRIFQLTSLHQIPIDEMLVNIPLEFYDTLTKEPNLINLAKRIGLTEVFLAITTFEKFTDFHSDKSSSNKNILNRFMIPGYTYGANANSLAILLGVFFDKFKKIEWNNIPFPNVFINHLFSLIIMDIVANINLHETFLQWLVADSSPEHYRLAMQLLDLSKAGYVSEVYKFLSLNPVNANLEKLILESGSKCGLLLQKILKDLDVSIPEKSIIEFSSQNKISFPFIEFTSELDYESSLERIRKKMIDLNSQTFQDSHTKKLSLETEFTLRISELLILRNGHLNLPIIAPLIEFVNQMSNKYRFHADYTYHLKRILTYLDKDPYFTIQIAEIYAPKRKTAAERILQKMLGLSENEIITNQDAKIAILSALLSRPRQPDEVGSCYGAQVSILGHSDMELLKNSLNDYIQLIHNGALTRYVTSENRKVKRDFSLSIPLTEYNRPILKENLIIRAHENVIANMAGNTPGRIMSVNLQFINEKYTSWISTFLKNEVQIQMTDDKPIQTSDMIDRLKKTFEDMVKPVVFYHKKHVLKDSLGAWGLIRADNNKEIVTLKDYLQIHIEMQAKVKAELLQLFPQQSLFIHTLFDDLKELVIEEFDEELSSNLPVEKKYGNSLLTNPSGGSMATTYITYNNLNILAPLQISFLPNSADDLFKDVIFFIQCLPKIEKEQFIAEPEKLSEISIPGHGLNLKPSLLIKLLDQERSNEEILDRLKFPKDLGFSNLSEEECANFINLFVCKLNEFSSGCAMIESVKKLDWKNMNLEEFGSTLLNIHTKNIGCKPDDETLLSIENAFLHSIPRKMKKLIPFIIFADTNWIEEGYISFGKNLLTGQLSCYQSNLSGSIRVHFDLEKKFKGEWTFISHISRRENDRLAI